MDSLEIWFWNALYQAIYLPITLILHLLTQTGTIFGIIVIGLFFNVVLTLILLFVPTYTTTTTMPTRPKHDEPEEPEQDFEEYDEEAYDESIVQEEQALGGENHEENQQSEQISTQNTD